MINDPKKTQGNKRSPKWRKVRKEFLRENPYCKACGGKTKIEVHHKKPFYLHPELELDPDNLITLCEAGKNGIVCHLAIGHLGSYQSINEDVDSDAVFWRDKVQKRPKK